MESNYPCICGHSMDMHYDPDDDGPDIIPGSGKCQEEKDRAPGSHHCSSCGYDPEDYCQCYEYKPDNLKYLEMKATNG